MTNSSISVRKTELKPARTECDAKSVIDDPELCRKAAKMLYKQYDQEVDYESYPRGCYFNPDIDSVYWNEHPIGKAHPKAEPICYTEKRE